MNVQASVILSTFRRAGLLRQTLDALVAIDTAGIDWQLIVVDNASDNQTAAVLESFAGRLPLQAVCETRAGKNNAMNAALGRAAGDLIVCTDDDVIPEVDWLQQVLAGAQRWPQADYFGGRILPVVPRGRSLVSLPRALLQSTYVIADWRQDEGPIRAWQVWGPNVTYRRSVFDRGFRFNPAIGPRGTDYPMGSESELHHRLEDAGMTCVYLPLARVGHVIREEQCELDWVLKRAQRQGRGDALLHGYSAGPRFLGAPRYMWRQFFEAWGREIRLRLSGDAGWQSAAYERHFRYGRLRQARLDYDRK